MQDSQSFDHIIVGTGQATGTLLAKLIPTGDSIAVIEGGAVGGTCVNYGCTPTKTLVASAKVAHMVRRASEYGVQTASPRIDFSAVRERMNKIRHGSRDGLTSWMDGTHNVSLIRGWASFESNHIIRIDKQLVEGNQIFINTGTRPVQPPITGIDDVDWLDNQKLLALGRQPNSDRLSLHNTDILVDDSGFIEVDDFCQTAATNVFALGDVNGRGAFTHTSVNDLDKAARKKWEKLSVLQN